MFGNLALYLHLKNQILYKMMEDKETKFKEIKSYLDTHEKLFEDLLRIKRIEDVLNNEELRHLYLVTLISSDTITDIESARASFDKLVFIMDNLKYMYLDPKFEKEVMRYINNGLEIINKDLNLFKK